MNLPEVPLKKPCHLWQGGSFNLSSQITAAPQRIGGPDDSGWKNQPPALRLISQFSTVNEGYGIYYVHDMRLDGSFLYLANTYGDPVYDVSNPHHPVFVSRLDARNGWPQSVDWGE